MKIMKKIFLIIISLNLFGLFSCEDRLEEEVYSFLSPANFYNTYDQGNAGVLGIYEYFNNRLWKGWHGLQRPLIYLTDNHLPGGAIGQADPMEMYNYTFSGNNFFVQGIYEYSYIVIFRCNTIIEALSDKEFDRVEELIGEAMFLRAHAYFNLVRLYGKVPLILNTKDGANATDFGRAPVNDVYSQIIDDLKYAEENMPEEAETGRPGKYAAKTMLADVYLTMAGKEVNDAAKLQLARNKAKEVMDAGVYQLVDDFWATHAKQFNNGPEHIFTIQAYEDIRTHLQLGNWYWPTDWRGGSGRAQATPTQDALDAFEIGDERFDDTFLQWYYDKNDNLITLNPRNESEAYVIKFADVDANNDQIGQDDANLNIYRYAEVLLIFAEAENELNGPTQAAYDAINEVRNRAELDELSGLSKDEFREALRKERRTEFYFEFKRWFDLKRWGNLVTTIKNHNPAKNIQSYHNLWPIPFNALELNPGLNGEQNPGY